MKTKISLLVVILLVLFVTITQANDVWYQNMRNLEKTLSSLYPKIVDPKAFADPKNKLSIGTDIDKFSKFTHGLSKPMTAAALPPDADPSIPLLLGTLEDAIGQASQAFAAGHTEYARGLLKNVSSTCMTCHTRTNQGGSFPVISLNIGSNDLSRFEMAGYLAATRRFDEALKAYDTIIGSEQKARKNYYEWEDAVEEALSVTVRFKKDPVATENILDKALANKAISDDLRKNIIDWKTTVKDWQSENPIEDVRPGALKNKITKLLAEAKTIKRTPTDDAALILNLRVSAFAHDLLRIVSSGPMAAEALYYVGVAHTSLSAGPAFYMPELYFAACIKEAPHTAISRTCYDKYKNLMTMNYSGSAGTSLPEGVVEKIKVLKSKAY